MSDGRCETAGLVWTNYRWGVRQLQRICSKEDLESGIVTKKSFNRGNK